MTGPVTLTVEVLSFEGVTEQQASLAAESFRQTLSALLSAGGLPMGIATDESNALEVRGVRVEPGEPARTGAQLAEAMYRRLSE